MRPTVRPDVHDAYWRFAAERLAIYKRRLEDAPDAPGPWTEDPVLAEYRFCNSYRAADRVSQYLIRDVIYAPQAVELAPEDIFLRVVLFRLFSKESTWEAIEQATGGLTRATLDVDVVGDVLEHRRTQGPIYTAAFILAAPSAYGHHAKHRNHLALVADMFGPGRLGSRLGTARSLADVFDALTSYPMIGPFLGYQIAVDLNYTAHLGFCENDFTVPGPGAVRGLRKVFADPGGLTDRQLIMRMVDSQDEQFARLGLEFPGLYGRPLHAIDCQSLFCETDKYSRVAFPELKSNRSRIKARFSPAGQLERPYFPPKWGLQVDGRSAAVAA